MAISTVSLPSLWKPRHNLHIQSTSGGSRLWDAGDPGRDQFLSRPLPSRQPFGDKTSCIFLQDTGWQLCTMRFNPISEKNIMGAGPACFEVSLDEELGFSTLIFSHCHCCPQCNLSRLVPLGTRPTAYTQDEKPHLVKCWSKTCVSFGKTDPDEACRGSKLPDPS